MSRIYERAKNSNMSENGWKRLEVRNANLTGNYAGVAMRVANTGIIRTSLACKGTEAADALA